MLTHMNLLPTHSMHPQSFMHRTNHSCLLITSIDNSIQYNEYAIAVVSFLCTAALSSSQSTAVIASVQLQSWTVAIICVLLLWSDYRNFNVQYYIFPNTTSCRLTCHAFSAPYSLSCWRSHWLKKTRQKILGRDGEWVFNKHTWWVL